METGRETSRSLVEQVPGADRRGRSARPRAAQRPRTQPRRARDRRRRSTPSGARGRVRGPLHGIPILLKDNIATGDRMMTTAGSLALAGAPAPADAFIVERLRAGGRRHPRQDQPQRVGELPVDAFVERLERPRRPDANPYALDRNPSGSSSGSGAAVAANLAAVGRRHRNRRIDRVALEQRARSSASSRRSASSAGRASFRSRTARTRPGPMARTVDRRRDAARRAGRIGSAAIAATSGRGRAGDGATTRRSLDRDGLRGARIGVVRNRLFGYSPAADRLAEAAIADMKRAGRGHRRSGEHPDARQVRRERVRRPALRVQGRSERVPRVARAGGASPLADGRHRVQQGAPERGAALLRSGNPGDGREEGAADRARSTRPSWRSNRLLARERRASTR